MPLIVSVTTPLPIDIGLDHKGTNVTDPTKTGTNARPVICRYCDGTGRGAERGQEKSGFHECGFCDGGVPLDTQEDWDRTWGRVLGDRMD